jgi:PKD repeat protein
MGEQGSGQAPTPEQHAAFVRKLEELEALGVPTSDLKRTLEERPQDFEAEADAAMRRELLGEEAPAPSPAGGPPAEPVRISGADGAPEPLVPALPASEGTQIWDRPPLEDPAAPAAAPTAPPPIEGAPLPEPPQDEVPLEAIEDLEAKLAAYIAEAPPAPATAPEPAVLEEQAGTPAAFESELTAELEQALAEAPPPSAEEAPPPLADGDDLSFVAAQPRPPVAAPGPKPPPPTGRAQAAPPPPQRVVVRKLAAPPGAKPAATAAAATEVLPVAEAPHRSAGKTAAGAAVVVLVLAATYLLLVNSPPVAAFAFSPASPVAGESVLFTANATTDPNGDAITFHWQFGDTVEADGPWVSHTYVKSGSYDVTLTATDAKKDAASAVQVVHVGPGSITPPVYRYGDHFEYAVTGRSHVEGVIGPLAVVNFTLGQFSGSCSVEAVDINYEGPQTRSVLTEPAAALDGFLEPHQTYVLERSLPALQLVGQINMSTADCPASTVAFSGSATADGREYDNLDNNDTVRAETSETLSVDVQDEAQHRYDSQATLTDFPELANASGQLHLEQVYAGHRFSTEDVDHGELNAEGVRWSWITQGTFVVRGALAVKVHLEAVNLPPAKVSRLFIDLWVSSASPFPLREYYYVQGYEGGNKYESMFDAQASTLGGQGAAPIPFQNLTRNYHTVAPSDLAPLGRVPRSNASPDFAFTAQTAYDEGVAQCPDMATFASTNPNAYAINGTYSRSTGNPKWTIDFSQDPSGETMRVGDEHSTVTQVSCQAGPDSAAVSRLAIGQVVSLNYAADLMKREQTAANLFAANAFDAAHANFTVKQDLHLPSVSLNAAFTASRSGVAYAFGAESLPSQPQRTSAYVDAQSGQLIYALVESGDRLP